MGDVLLREIFPSVLVVLLRRDLFLGRWGMYLHVATYSHGKDLLLRWNYDPLVIQSSVSVKKTVFAVRSWPVVVRTMLEPVEQTI